MAVGPTVKLRSAAAAGVAWLATVVDIRARASRPVRRRRTSGSLFGRRTRLARELKEHVKQTEPSVETRVHATPVHRVRFDNDDPPANGPDRVHIQDDLHRSIHPLSARLIALPTGTPRPPAVPSSAVVLSQTSLRSGIAGRRTRSSCADRAVHIAAATHLLPGGRITADGTMSTRTRSTPASGVRLHPQVTTRPSASSEMPRDPRVQELKRTDVWLGI